MESAEFPGYIDITIVNNPKDIRDLFCKPDLELLKVVPRAEESSYPMTLERREQEKRHHDSYMQDVKLVNYQEVGTQVHTHYIFGRKLGGTVTAMTQKIEELEDRIKELNVSIANINIESQEMAEKIENQKAEIARLREKEGKDKKTREELVSIIKGLENQIKEGIVISGPPEETKKERTVILED